MFNKANQAMYLYFLCKHDASEFIHKNTKKMIISGTNVKFIFDDDSAVQCKIVDDEIISMSLLH